VTKIGKLPWNQLFEIVANIIFNQHLNIFSQIEAKGIKC